MNAFFKLSNIILKDVIRFIFLLQTILQMNAFFYQFTKKCIFPMPNGNFFSINLLALIRLLKSDSFVPSTMMELYLTKSYLGYIQLSLINEAMERFDRKIEY